MTVDPTGRFLSALRRQLEPAGAVLVDDPALLGGLLDVRDLPPETIRTLVDQLVAAGRLRRVFIGSEPHLALSRETPLAPATAPASARVLTLEPTQTEAPASTPTSSAVLTPAEDTRFNLALEIDAATEKLLLYRVLIIFEVIAGLLLAREWTLWWLEL